MSAAPILQIAALNDELARVEAARDAALARVRELEEVLRWRVQATEPAPVGLVLARFWLGDVPEVMRWDGEHWHWFAREDGVYCELETSDPPVEWRPLTPGPA